MSYGGRIILEWVCPQGTTGQYTPAEADFPIYPDGAALPTADTDLYVNTGGWLYANAASFKRLRFADTVLPAKAAGDTRIYEVWGTMGESCANDEGLFLNFNRSDSNGHGWYAYWVYYSGSSACGTLISQATPTWTARTSTNTANNVRPRAGDHTPFFLTLYDCGDDVGTQCGGLRQNTTGLNATGVRYYAASRTNKSSQGVHVGLNNSPTGDDVRVYGFRVTDLPFGGTP